MNIDRKETLAGFLDSGQDSYPGDIFLVNTDGMELKGETHHVTQQTFFFFFSIYSNELKNIHLHKNPTMDIYSTCVHNFQTKKGIKCTVTECMNYSFLHSRILFSTKNKGVIRPLKRQAGYANTHQYVKYANWKGQYAVGFHCQED